jgi:hypothetical protein
MKEDVRNGASRSYAQPNLPSMPKYVRASVGYGDGYDPPPGLVPASAIHRCFLMHWCLLVHLCLVLRRCTFQRFSRKTRLSMAGGTCLEIILGPAVNPYRTVVLLWRIDVACAESADAACGAGGVLGWRAVRSDARVVPCRAKRP